MSNMNTNNNFSKSIHRVGRITVLLALSCFFALPIILALYYKVNVDIPKILGNTTPLLITFATTAVCENISFAPIIGAGGLYLACVTGNVGNLKVPAALNAMDIVKCDPGSEKGEIVSIISIAVSSLVTVVIIFLGMLFLGPLIEPIFSNPYVQPAFNNLIPALFGSLLAPFILKNKKESIVPIILPAIFLLIISREKFSVIQGYVMPIFIIISMFYSYSLNKNLCKISKQSKNTEM